MRATFVLLLFIGQASWSFENFYVENEVRNFAAIKCTETSPLYHKCELTLSIIRRTEAEETIYAYPRPPNFDLKKGSVTILTTNSELQAHHSKVFFSSIENFEHLILTGARIHKKDLYSFRLCEKGLIEFDSNKLSITFDKKKMVFRSHNKLKTPILIGIGEIRSHSSIYEMTQSMRSCNSDDDCTYEGGFCPIGCYIPVNKIYSSQAKVLIEKARKSQSRSHCEYNCGATRASCAGGLCSIKAGRERMSDCPILKSFLGAP